MWRALSISPYAEGTAAALAALRESLRARGSELIVLREGPPEQALPALVKSLGGATDEARVWASAELETGRRSRLAAVGTGCAVTTVSPSPLRAWGADFSTPPLSTAPRMGWGLEDIARHVVDTHLNPRLLN
jgi:hypothetical protein